MWRNSGFAALTLALTSTLAGCALDSSIHSGGKASYPERNEVPIAANFRTSNQLKLQAAEHWRRVANNSADALVKSLQGGLVGREHSLDGNDIGIVGGMRQGPRRCQQGRQPQDHESHVSSPSWAGAAVFEETRRPP